MQIENDYDKDVYNGDIGTVEGVDAEAGELNRRVRRTPHRVRVR